MWMQGEEGGNAELLEEGIALHAPPAHRDDHFVIHLEALNELVSNLTPPGSEKGLRRYQAIIDGVHVRGG
jgi:hypothetical protein